MAIITLVITIIVMVQIIIEIDVADAVDVEETKIKKTTNPHSIFSE